MLNKSLEINHLGLVYYINKLVVLFPLIIISLSVSAAPVSYQFNGTVLGVFALNGGGTFAAVSEGDTFSGALRYSTNPEDAFYTELNEGPASQVETEWWFSGGDFGGTLTDGITTVNAPTVVASIDSNFSVSDEEVDFFNDALVRSGQLPIFTTGDTIDVWDTSTEYFNDINGLTDGVFFGVALITLDTSLYTGYDFEPFPRDLQDYDLSLFFVEERIDNEIVFEAYGFLNAGTVVPIPAALYLFGSGLLGLIGLSRRKKA